MNTIIYCNCPYTVRQCWSCLQNPGRDQGVYINFDKGWICPKCGLIWAPGVKGCEKCNKADTESKLRDCYKEVTE